MSYEVGENKGLRRLMHQPNFKHENYVKSVVRAGDSEISKNLNLLGNWSDNTANELKKVIYEHSNLFVDASKAVSQLETNMHLINHDLTEQKRLINELIELKLAPDLYDAESNADLSNLSGVDESDSEHKMLIEQIDGISEILLKPDRSVVFVGDLQELNAENFSIQAAVKLILLTDLLLIAKKYPQSHGDMKFRLVYSYELSNVAVVNVSERDFSSAANVFKIIAFPDTKVFKAESSKIKVQWMQLMENQLRSRQIRPISNTTKTVENVVDVTQDVKDSVESSALPDWLLELPDDLDVAIAERDLSTAVELVERAKKFLETSANDSNDRARADLSTKLDFRVAQLTEALTDELAAGSGRRGGLRSVRTAVSLLNRLGKRGLACELFLTHRSAVLTQKSSQVTREGSQAVYAASLSLVFHRGLVETCHEFRSIIGRFDSRLFCWCITETRRFTEQLRILLVESKAVPFLGLCPIMGRIRLHARTVGESIGADIEAEIEAGLIDCWEKLATEHAKVLRDALDMRAVDEQWTSIVFSGQKDKATFLRDMSEAGLEVTGFLNDLTVTLTNNTCQLGRSVCLFAEGLRRLGCSNLTVLLQDSIADVMAAELRHYQRWLASSQCFQNQRSFILENLMFVCTSVLPKLEIGEAMQGSKFHQIVQDYQLCLNNSASMSV